MALCAYIIIGRPNPTAGFTAAMQAYVARRQVSINYLFNA